MLWSALPRRRAGRQRSGGPDATAASPTSPARGPLGTAALRVLALRLGGCARPPSVRRLGAGRAGADSTSGGGPPARLAAPPPPRPAAAPLGARPPRGAAGGLAPPGPPLTPP